MKLQWGSEYRPFEYQTFWSSDFKWIGIQKAGLCAMSYGTIQILDQYIIKQDGVHLCVIQMIRLSSIQMVFQ